MQSPPFPHYLLPPRSKYSPQHHVLRHPQLPFLPQFQRPSFTHIQNNRQNYSNTTDLTVIIFVNFSTSQIVHFYLVHLRYCSMISLTLTLRAETCRHMYNWQNTVVFWMEYILLKRGPGSSVGIATDYGLDGPGSNPSGDEISRPSRPALWPTQPPVQWVLGLCRG